MILMVLATTLSPLEAGPLLISSPGGGAATLTMTTFASGLNYPIGMAVVAPGQVIVGTTTPDAALSGTALGYLRGSGQLMKLTDANFDGVADGPGVVVFSGLPGAVTDVKTAGVLLAAATTGEGGPHAEVADVSLLAPSGGGFTNLGSLHLTYPRENYNINLATAPVPGQPTQSYLYFHVAAGTDDAQAGPAIGLSGLATGSLQGGSVYRVIVDSANPGNPVSGLTQIAYGIRNSGGMTVDSAGRLLFTDNGYENGPTLVSADELNILQAAQLGGPAVDMGYPSNYIDYSTGLPVAANGQNSAVAFTGAQQRLGIAGVVEGPTGFPADLSDGYFVSFHGNFFQTGVGNQWNPVVFYTPATDSFFDFLLPGQAGLGSIDSLAASPGWLYMADLAADSPFAPASGNIYAFTVTAVPEPATWMTGFSLLALFTIRRMIG